MPILIDAVPIKNTTTEVIPAFGLMRRVGVNTDGVMEVAKPNADGQLVVVNGPTAIPPSTFYVYGTTTVAGGQGTYNPRTIIAYNETDGTPAAGETWGAANGEWVARKNKAGFQIDGGAGYGLVNAIRWGADSLVSSWKTVVRVATTANGTLATAFENGDTVDGITIATGDRILLKNQTSGAENGIYTINASGAPTRATDSDTGSELVGAVVFVSVGTVNAKSIWTCTTPATITIDSTATVWAQVWTDAFPAQLTSTYSSGYSWKRRVLAAGVYADASPSVTGTNNAFEVSANTSLASGTNVMMWYVPIAGQYEFSASNVQDEGTSATPRPTLNFIGANVTVTDDSGNNRTNVTIAGGTITSTGPGWLQGLRTTDCLALIVVSASGLSNDIDTTQIVPLGYSASTWTSAGLTPAVFNYDGGSGTVVLGFTTDFFPYLTINGIYLTYDGAGIEDGVAFIDFTGGPRNGMGTTGTPEDDCGGNWFKVRIGCSCCQDVDTITATGDGTWVATCTEIDVECYGVGGAGG